MTIDLFPAQVFIDDPASPGHPGYNKVRLYVKDTMAWIILEEGTIAREFDDVVIGDGSFTDGPVTVTFQRGGGCNCHGQASAITAMDLGLRHG